jgi:hypothetical protein
MSLNLGPRNIARISVRKDVNSTNRPGMQVRKLLLGNPIQIASKPGYQFNPAGTLSATSILSLARSLVNDVYPPVNFTETPQAAGTLELGGLSLGLLDIMVIPGQTIDPSISDANSQLFSQREDVASAWILVKGNLTLQDSVIQPSKRKLFTVVYVTGNLTINGTSQISMTQRGANHSGTGTSGGATTPELINVGPNTRIAAEGAAGAPSNDEPETALQGSSGATDQTGLQSGGGGGGWNDTDLPSYGPATMGRGAAGTCFSGGSGGGGSANPADYTSTGSAETNGGAGGLGIDGAGADRNPAGAGNPNGSGDKYNDNDGTGGTLIVIVEGTISTNNSGASLFRARGTGGVSFVSGVNYPTPPFGGGSGGGIVVVAAQNGSSFTTNVSATGGTDSLAGANAGNGAAVAYNLSAF